MLRPMRERQSENSFEAFLHPDEGYVPRRKSVYNSLCIRCGHLESVQDETCEAFPSGIPRKIWEGDADHTVPVEGDHGVTFEPQ